MRRAVAAALVFVVSGCGHKAEQPAANQSNVSENAAAETNAGGNTNEESASENNEMGTSGNTLGTLPPSDAALRFVGRWARNKADCATKPWTFTKGQLNATDGPHCSIYNVKAVPGGYDLAAECPAKKPDPTDLIKLRFAESARAMLVESNAIEPMGLIYCGT
jgi:hypothetical protein